LLARKPEHTVFRVTQALTPGITSSRAGYGSAAPLWWTSHGLPVALKGHDDEAAKAVERAYWRSRGAHRTANRRVLNDVRTAWHASAMLAGTLRTRSVGRLPDGWTLSHARRPTLRVANTACEGRRIETRPPISGRRHVDGTVAGTVTGRWTARVDRVERNPAVMDGRFGESRMGLEEVSQEV
jgi:hypothetical protein